MYINYIYIILGEGGRESEREREREREREGAEGEGERESQVGSMPSTKLHAGLNLTTLISWPEPEPIVGCSTNWATQEPNLIIYF